MKSFKIMLPVAVLLVAHADLQARVARTPANVYVCYYQGGENVLDNVFVVKTNADVLSYDLYVKAAAKANLAPVAASYRTGSQERVSENADATTLSYNNDVLCEKVQLVTVNDRKKRLL